MQQELSQEREKYNQMLLKYQDLQQQAVEDQQVKQKMSMEIDCKATEIEHLQSKLNETASLSSADNDPEDTQVCLHYSVCFLHGLSCFSYFRTPSSRAFCLCQINRIAVAARTGSDNM